MNLYVRYLSIANYDTCEAQPKRSASVIIQFLLTFDKNDIYMESGILNYDLLAPFEKREVNDFIDFLLSKRQKNRKRGPDGFECLEEDKLNSMAISVSERSLHEAWKNEDDAHWESFLKD